MKREREQAHRAARDDKVRVRGAREHNLRDVDVDIPRDALVVISGLHATLMTAGTKPETVQAGG